MMAKNFDKNDMMLWKLYGKPNSKKPLSKLVQWQERWIINLSFDLGQADDKYFETS